MNEENESEKKGNPKPKNQWDCEGLKKNAKMFIYAYSGDQIHSIFVADDLTDRDEIRRQCRQLSPQITRLEEKEPTLENWAFVEKHYDDDIDIEHRNKSEQEALFKKGGIIIHMPGAYVLSWANSGYRGSNDKKNMA